MDRWISFSRKQGLPAHGRERAASGSYGRQRGREAAACGGQRALWVLGGHTGGLSRLEEHLAGHISRAILMEGRSFACNPDQDEI